MNFLSMRSRIFGCGVNYRKSLALAAVSLIVLCGCSSESEESRGDASASIANLPEIEFFQSRDIANAHASIEQYIRLLKGGEFAEAAALAQRVRIQSAISANQQVNIAVFVSCADCHVGRCRLCSGSGVCARCKGSTVCRTCGGNSQRSRPCTACQCVTCGGSRICASCNGQGAGACTRCRGTGWGRGHQQQTCTQCNGAGSVSWQLTRGHRFCPRCGGSGSVDGRRNRCPICRGTAQAPCSDCGGRRQCGRCPVSAAAVCRRCNGAGEEVAHCPECDGKSVCPPCAGRASCGPCMGTGDCRTCKAVGFVLAHNLPADSAWLNSMRTTVTDDAIGLVSESPLVVVVGERTIPLPSDRRTRTVVVSHSIKYAAAARQLLKE